MTNGNKQQSLFSNPLVLLLVGVGVALVAVLLLVAVLRPGAQIATKVVTGGHCYCKGAYGAIPSPGSRLPSPTPLCPDPWVKGEGTHPLQPWVLVCEDEYFEHTDIKDEETCKKKNNVAVFGYTKPVNVTEQEKVEGYQMDCKIIESTSSPTLSATPSSSD